MSAFSAPYRIYCYDSTAKLVTSDWLDASSDEDAIAEAHARGFGTKCEIWNGNRLVAKLGQDEDAQAFVSSRPPTFSDTSESGMPA